MDVLLLRIGEIKIDVAQWADTQLVDDVNI